MPSDPPVSDIITVNSNFGALVKEIDKGLSESRVYWLEDSGRKSILKIQKDKTEFNFYTEFAPQKFPQADWLPELLASGAYGNWNWLQLEFVPNAWPESRFNKDRRALEILSALHKTEAAIGDFDWFNYQWPASDIGEYCEKHLPSKAITRLCNFQEALTLVSGTKHVLCSGDPYPLNWLMRDDGRLVLIDWQRVSFENPAFDLAGWISTLISYREIRWIAETYLKLSTRSPAVSDESIEILAHDVVVFFCCRCATNFKQAVQSAHPERWQRGLDRLIENFPPWLEEVSWILDNRRRI